MPITQKHNGFFRSRKTALLAALVGCASVLAGVLSLQHPELHASLPFYNSPAICGNVPWREEYGDFADDPCISEITCDPAGNSYTWDPQYIQGCCKNDSACLTISNMYGGQCGKSFCDTNTHTCESPKDGQACDDDNPCTEGDTCSGKGCTPGAPKCGDGEACKQTGKTTADCVPSCDIRGANSDCQCPDTAVLAIDDTGRHCVPNKCVDSGDPLGTTGPDPASCNPDDLGPCEQVNACDPLTGKCSRSDKCSDDQKCDGGCVCDPSKCGKNEECDDTSQHCVSKCQKKEESGECNTGDLCNPGSCDEDTGECTSAKTECGDGMKCDPTDGECVCSDDKKVQTGDGCFDPCTNGGNNPPDCNECDGDQVYNKDLDKCFDACSNGTNNPPNCNQCDAPQVFTQGQCLDPCTNGANNPPLCDQCDSPQTYAVAAQRCAGPCLDNSIPDDNGLCLKKCKDGTYVEESQDCSDCTVTGCASNDEVCNPDSGQCVMKCPDGSPSDNGRCDPSTFGVPPDAPVQPGLPPPPGPPGVPAPEGSQYGPPEEPSAPTDNPPTTEPLAPGDDHPAAPGDEGGNPGPDQGKPAVPDPAKGNPDQPDKPGSTVTTSGPNPPVPPEEPTNPAAPSQGGAGFCGDGWSDPVTESCDPANPKYCQQDCAAKTTQTGTQNHLGDGNVIPFNAVPAEPIAAPAPSEELPSPPHIAGPSVPLNLDQAKPFVPAPVGTNQLQQRGTGTQDVAPAGQPAPSAPLVNLTPDKPKPAAPAEPAPAVPSPAPVIPAAPSVPAEPVAPVPPAPQPPLPDWKLDIVKKAQDFAPITLNSDDNKQYMSPENQSCVFVADSKADYGVRLDCSGQSGLGASLLSEGSEAAALPLSVLLATLVGSALVGLRRR